MPPGEAGPRSARPWPVVAVTAGCVVVLTVLCAWAAAVGPGDVLPGSGGPRMAGAERSLPSADLAPRPDVTPSSLDLSWLLWVLLGLALALVVGAVALLVQAIGFSWPERRPVPVVDDTEFPEVLPRAVTREVASGAEDQLRALDDGTARNGIVACWSRFETAAVRAGLPRERWETSAEFTLRMLDLIAADQGAVERLAELFREARFSEHPMDEGHRGRARQALEVIHAGLGATERAR